MKTSPSFIPQLDLSDGLVACLLMVARLSQPRLDLHEIEEIITARGFSLHSDADVTELGSSIGVNVRAVHGHEIPWNDAAADICEFLAVELRSESYVIISSMKRRQAIVLDPRTGKRRMRKAELEAEYSSRCFVFAPRLSRSRFSRNGKLIRSLGHELRLIRPSRRILAITVITLMLSQAFMLFPVMAAHWINIDTYAGASGGRLVKFALMFCCAIFFAHLTTVWLQSWVLGRLTEIIDRHLLKRVSIQLCRLSLAFHMSRGAGDLIGRLATLPTVRAFIISDILSGLLNILVMISCLILTAYYDEGQLALMLAFILTKAALALVLEPRLREVAAAESAAFAKHMAQQISMLIAIEDIKVNAGMQIPPILESKEDLISSARAKAQLQESVAGTLRAIDAIFPCILVLLAVYRQPPTVSRNIVQTELPIVLLLCLFINSASTELLRIITTASRMRSTFLRLLDILEANSKSPTSALSSEVTLSVLELRDVSIGFNRQAPAIVRNATFRIEPGSFVAVVGSSGSGKSTLLRAIVGLTDIRSGRIFYGDKDITAGGLGALGPLTAYMSQTCYFPAGTILEVVKAFRPAATMLEIESAAETAQILNEVRAMPRGWATHLPPGGGFLSGGQRQRILLTRALVQQPRILILDEAMSQIDQCCEQKIMCALKNLQLTAVIATHRVATLGDFDLVLRFDPPHIRTEYVDAVTPTLKSAGSIVSCG